MPFFVALLRGVNVGGHRKLTSATLKDVCERAGATSVRIYLQSGNAVFRTTSRSAAAVAGKIRDELEKATRLDAGVLVRSTADLRDVVARNPFTEAASREPSRLLVAFLSEEPSPAASAVLHRARTGSELLHVSGREVYSWFPDGAGRSKLASAFAPTKLGVECTARNWNTVTALLQLAEEMEHG